MPDARVAIHIALTAVMAWLGVILALPGDTFATSTGYALMARVMPEISWALAFWMVATIGALGFSSNNRHVKMLSVMIVATGHAIFAMFLLAANPVTTGSGTYSILAMLGYYLAYRRAHGGF